MFGNKKPLLHDRAAKTQFQTKEIEACFAEIPAPPPSQATEPAKALAATIWLGEAAIDGYEGVDANMVEALRCALKLY